MTELGTVSLGLAFLAGLVSFLSPCVFPIVPSYVGFVTGLTLDELKDGSRSDARRQAAIHAALFVLGFSLVFLALGASATALGGVLRRSLPLLQQVGGVVIVLFGLYMLGVLKIPALLRERRVQLASKPAGKLGSVVVGIAFGAGWTPCVGPVLASVLLYASFEETMTRGMLLLGAYALGLGIPFFVSAVALNWFLAGSAKVRRWLLPLERAAGVVMVLVGVLLFTGHFAALSGFLAQFSPALEVGL
ncbi:MAG TPA: cytochrome c biogenesis protein CcdA [Longimicrobiaceae bacterium]|nr:cytochrome c biogenesis protein CcdA [Longimicrobiaceae bacterium]